MKVEIALVGLVMRTFCVIINIKTLNSYEDEAILEFIQERQFSSGLE